MTGFIRRNGPFLALWLLASLLLIWLSRDAIAARSGWDPDDQLRLVQLRDFLGGQSWFDTTQYRMNTPDGAPMHWSRLVELPLALIILLLAPLTGGTQAEMVASVAVPLFCLGGVAFFLAQIGGTIGGRPVAIAAFMLALIAPAMLIQLRPMRIDHHGWQIFCAVLALASLYWDNSKRAGLVLGAALATWIHISLEGAPMTAAFFLLLGWRWIARPEQSARLFWTLCGFAGLSMLLFFGTQPAGLAATQYCDTVSPAHLWAIGAASALLLPATARPPQSGYARAAVAGVAAIAAIAILVGLIPQCTQGAFGELDPVVRSYWYDNIREGLPVWRQQWQPAVTLMTPLLVGMAAYAFAWRRLDAHQRSLLATSGYFLLYGSLLSMLVFRTVSVATAFTIVPAALCLTMVVQSYRQERRLCVRLLFVPMVLGLIGSGMVAGALLARATPEKRERPERAGEKLTPAQERALSRCESPDSVKALSALPTARIVAPFNMGPAILMTTQHSVLASNHHRNHRGMRDQIDLFRLPPAQAKRIVDRRALRYLVTCPDEAEMRQYRQRAPRGLWARIASGDAPDWLLYQGRLGKGLMVWRVR